MLAFSLVRTDEVMRGWKEGRAGESDSLKMTSLYISRQQAFVPHSLLAVLWDECSVTRADPERRSSFCLMFEMDIQAESVRHAQIREV